MDKFKHFSNKECEFYPCHSLENQNCLFCYCPMYTHYCPQQKFTDKGIKDCSDCIKNHDENSFIYITSRLSIFNKGANGENR